MPNAPILEYNQAALDTCARLLRDDELVAVPTETVYGLAGNALSVSAVRKIFEVKGRPLIDPLITHFKDWKEAFALVKSNAIAERLSQAYWPGPLTMVLDKTTGIPDLVTAGLQTAAIRVPAHPILQQLLQSLEFPLAAPSANPFGYVSPTQPNHVQKTLGHRIGAILDGGVCHHGIESTVVDVRDPDDVRVLRPGPISALDIEQLLRKKIFMPTRSEAGCAQISPGLLSRHYSPNTEIVILEPGQLDIRLREGDAMVCNRKPLDLTHSHTYWLSEDGNLQECARNFFALIQNLDHQGYHRLLVEALPPFGLGIAINDRLKRAASKLGKDYSNS